mgnify:CR=1 FL=1
MEHLDVFERLKRLQQQLKEDIVANPKIQMTDDYKKMEEKYKEIVSATDQIQQRAENQQNEWKQENNTKDITQRGETNQNKELMHSNQEKDLLEIKDDGKELVETQEQEKDIVETKEQGKDIAEIKEQDKEIMEVSNQEKQFIEGNEQSEELEDQAEKTQDEKVEEVKDKILSFESMYREIFGKEPYGGRLKPEDPNKKPEQDKYKITEEELDDNVSVFEEMEAYKKPTYKFIGIAFKTYIILEMNQELYIMDQHAAHERILYERVKKNFFSETEKESQMLLLPDVITLTNKEMGIAKDNLALFERAGFVVEEFGENTLKVSGVPDICVDLDTKELFMETLDEINTVARTAKQEKEEKFIATVACKAAVKANMALTEEEVTSLMNELLKLPNPFSCPHGRPTVIKMSKYDIERKFARK